MLIEFNPKISYSIINENICTLYVKPNHSLNDILMCKRYVRDKHNKYMYFRETISIRK